MHRTMMLFGHCDGANPGSDGIVAVSWTDAANFQDVASHMIEGEFGAAVVVPVNATAGCGRESAVRFSLERPSLNFKGFQLRMWLGEEPVDAERSLGAVDFDWIAYIPCAAYLTG